MKYKTLKEVKCPLCNATLFMNEKPYLITLRSDSLEVSLPDKDGDICIEKRNLFSDNERIYLSKDDVLKLLERFD